jgi:hypothetical protein
MHRLLYAPLPSILALLGPAQEPPAPPREQAGPPPSLPYDASAELTLQGTVTAVQARGRMPMITLTFLAGTTPWPVRLAPREVLDRLGFTPSLGDALVIVGCPSEGPEGSCFLARRVIRGETVVTLLDASGHPQALLSLK